MSDKEFPPSPFAKYSGKLQLGNTTVDCYVFDTEERVISLRAAGKAITNLEGGKLGEYIGVKALKPYINKQLVLGETIEFNIPGTQFTGKGITTKNFLTICRAFVNAFAADALLTDRQKEIAINCSVLLSACAEIGLDALVDEATGYQYERQPDALTIKSQAFFTPDNKLREWEKTFPDELWEEFGRLTNYIEADNAMKETIERLQASYLRLTGRSITSDEIERAIKALYSIAAPFDVEKSFKTI